MSSILTGLAALLVAGWFAKAGEVAPTIVFSTLMLAAFIEHDLHQIRDAIKEKR